MKKRFTLLIGAHAADTTGLFSALGFHPQVLASRVAEPHFFTDDRKWALGPDFYRSLWDFREPDERIALEASSDYARHPSIPCPAERVARMPSGFRFLYLLRDPLERIERHHARAVEEGGAGGSLAERVPPEILNASRYAAQLDAWRAHFPPEDFLLLCHEEWLRDPSAVLRRACSFLEIDPYFSFSGVRAVEKPPGGLRRWLAGLRRRPAAASAAESLLPAAQRARLLDELGDDLRRLESEWRFDLSRWRLAP